MKQGLVIEFRGRHKELPKKSKDELEVSGGKRKFEQGGLEEGLEKMKVTKRCKEGSRIRWTSAEAMKEAGLGVTSGFNKHSWKIKYI